MTPSPGGAGARGAGARGDLLPSVNVASVPSQVEESWRRLPPSSDVSLPIPCRGGETAVLPTSTPTSAHDEPELDVSQLDISALTSPPANGAKCVVLLVLGSFNPPHTWHARLPAIVKDALKAPSRRFPAGAHVVGAYLSPVHDGYGKPGLVKAEHRIAMARLAVAHEPGVGVDTWEATRSQHQRSLAVARALHRRVGDFALAHGASEVPAVVIACGSDLVKSMATPGHWRPEDVQALTSDEHGVVAVLRAGAEDVDTARAEASSCPWLAQAVSSGGVLFVGSGDAASSCLVAPDPFMDDEVVQRAGAGEISAAAGAQQQHMHEAKPESLPWMDVAAAVPSYGSASLPVGGTAPRREQQPASVFPSWSKATGTSSSESALKMREEQLAEREKRLAERERELSDREWQVAQGVDGGRPPNWPRCRPTYYHDIDEEVLPEKRDLVRAGYNAWCLSVAGYFMNWIAILALVAGNTGYGFSNFLWATMNLIGGVYLSWTCWYQSLYKAGQTEAAVLPHVAFFLHFSIHTFWCYFTVLAVPYLGNFMAGIFTMLFAFPQGVFYGILCVLNIAIWSLDALVSTYVLGSMFRRFRGAGGIEATRQQGSLASSLFQSATGNAGQLFTTLGGGGGGSSTSAPSSRPAGASGV